MLVVDANNEVSSGDDQRTIQPRAHKWSAIEDLPNDWVSLADAQAAAIVSIWQEQQSELRSRGVLDKFLERLKRQWAVETGAIEDVYKISEGATKTLIEHGLDAALISHDDVDDAPQAVVRKITDQLDAVNGLYQFVSSQRTLTKSYILELHQVITAHQMTYQARDTLGNPVAPQLPRGQWKKLPNNLEGHDGRVIFEFCPPVQVESEIDHLLELNRSHEEKKVSPDVEAAWLHHRFVLIHPFTDGNGRIARCLATLVFLKRGWLPLVVTRHDKPAYIAALRAADNGDLAPLVHHFGKLQQKAIRDALSVGNETLLENGRMRGVLESVRSKFEKRKESLNELIQQAHATADLLQLLATKRLEEAATEIKPVLDVATSDYTAFATHAPRDSDNAHYNYYQIVQYAKHMGYFANLDAYRSWASLTIRTESRTEILYSLHGLGHGNTGVFVCAAMVYSRRTDESGDSVIDEITPITDEPFQFAYGEDRDNVQKRFAAWLDDSLAKGLAIWGDNVL